MRVFRNERGVVLNWIFRIVLVLGVIGVLIFDAGSMAVNYFTLDSTSDTVALAVARAVEAGEIQPSNQRFLKQLARKTLREDGVDARVLRAEVDEEHILHLRLRREATTIVAKYLPPVHRWTIATVESDEEATPPS